jgi:hypothetical protein
MNIYDKFAFLLKDRASYPDVSQEIQELEDRITHELRGAKSVKLGIESIPERLVFYVKGKTLMIRAREYHTGDYEIIAVKSLTHGVQAVTAAYNGSLRSVAPILTILKEQS